ncbi:MAG: hypothetical protein ABI134_27485, partial [Byssovorax sp.]
RRRAGLRATLTRPSDGGEAAPPRDRVSSRPRMSSFPASDLLGADVVRELELPKIAGAPRLAAANLTRVAESDLHAKRKAA